MNIGETLLKLWNNSGFAAMFVGFADGGWQNLVMLIIACVLLYLAIVKQFEPLLLCGIASAACCPTCPWAVCTTRSCGMLSWIPLTLPTIPMARS